MKKIFTLLLITFTSISFAQVDWAIKSIKSPTELESTASGTTLALTIECENKGTSPIYAGDSVIYNMLIIDKASSQIITEFPQNASRGSAAITIITKEVPVGGTYEISNTLNSNLYLTQSREVRLGVSTFIFDRTSPYIDSDSSNNTNFVDIVWWNQQRWNVSVEDVKYNSDNIVVYPNPANDQLNVSLLFAKSNAVNIELFDLTGKAVASPNMNQTISPSQYTLDVADLNKGVYILKVTNGTKVSTSKVTISH